jgi:murein DD-endopeptidase
VELQPAGTAESDLAGTRLLFEGAEVPLTFLPGGARGLFALGPEQEPGQTNLTLLVDREQGPARYDLALEVAATAFPESSQRLELGVYSDVDHADDPRVQTRIREGARRRSVVLAEHSPDRLSWALAHPRDRHVITSPFWAIRVYHRYQVQEGRTVALPSSRRIHRGLDLRGRQGDPVFAIADGQVVLAEELHYEGKLTIIDHGYRIFSFYMHQDEIVVSPGQMVTGGTLIGRVGSTGQSTAPHLHVSLTINGVHVDPLSLLALPIRR